MEIYRNTSQDVYLDITGSVADDKPTAVLHDQETEVELDVDDSPTTVGGAERWTAYIPLSQTQNDKAVYVVWEFSVDGESASKKDYIGIVTPLATLGQIKDAVGTSYSDSELKRAERRVRKIIESYTSQTFGRYEGSLGIYGAGDTKLSLPRPLISFTTVIQDTTEIDAALFDIYGESWFLGASKTMYEGDVTYTDIIGYPYGAQGCTVFADDILYTIAGVWGYNGVPTEVSEAAIMLIEDILCPQNEYRNRYLTSMKSSDWRIEFNDLAFYGTGNAMADMLLAPYRLPPAIAVV